MVSGRAPGRIRRESESEDFAHSARTNGARLAGFAASNGGLAQVLAAVVGPVADLANRELNVGKQPFKVLAERATQVEIRSNKGAGRIVPTSSNGGLRVVQGNSQGQLDG
jgi:hypothetical protein